MFIQEFFTNPVFYLTWVVLVVFSICVHEASHAWTAYKQGDSTAVDNGYLTLDPLKVMGGMSLLFVVIVGIAWGAVPVNPQRFRSRASHAIVSASGPAANFTLAALFGSLLFFLVRYGSANADTVFYRTLWLFFGTGTQVNIVLGIFNMLPLPIFDGWEVFSFIIPGLRRIPRQKAQQFGLIALLVIFMTNAHQPIWDISLRAVLLIMRLAAGGQ